MKQHSLPFFLLATLVVASPLALAQRSKTAAKPKPDRLKAMLQGLNAPALRVDVLNKVGLPKSAPKCSFGEAFRLRVRAQSPGDVYILALDAKGTASLVKAAAKPFSASPKTPLDLPVFTAPKAKGALEYLILQRRYAFLGSSGTNTDVPGTDTNVPGTDTDVPALENISELISLFESDPKGTWVSTRIKVEITK
ncbi:hypothetical protein [Armatimonas sp.]|uniref:hypothetical protein n=1 Tax=Armatimonas sp. TaxID=1872638 RepID=UPI00286A9E3E|nr:hypothetical protein [Armatimonas sp.]